MSTTSSDKVAINSSQMSEAYLKAAQRCKSVMNDVLQPRVVVHTRVERIGG